MTTTTHTPGPWVYEHATKTIRAKPSNYWLASMDSFDGAVCHEANARLIAAAPDLLAVAAMLDRIAGQVPFTGPFHDAIVAARAAIVKAKGE